MPALFCGACGTVINELFDLPADKRPPCPKCGSTSRSVTIAGQDFVFASALVTGNVNTDSLTTLPPLLMQSVLTFVHTTQEGRLVAAVAEPWFEIIAELERDPDMAFRLSAERWEHIVAGAYQRAGFTEVILTPRSGDFGRDVIATMRGVGTVRVIDQVKAYGRGHLVTANDVRALVGTLEMDGASKGFLTTTSDFAPRLPNDPLLKKVMPGQLELINGVKLLERLKELAKKK